MHIANYIDPGTTDRLISELFKTDNIEAFLRAHEGELVVSSFAEYITQLCKQKKTTVSKVLDKADIAESRRCAEAAERGRLWRSLSEN